MLGGRGEFLVSLWRTGRVAFKMSTECYLDVSGLAGREGLAIRVEEFPSTYDAIGEILQEGHVAMSHFVAREMRLIAHLSQLFVTQHCNRLVCSHCHLPFRPTMCSHKPIRCYDCKRRIDGITLVPEWELFFEQSDISHRCHPLTIYFSAVNSIDWYCHVVSL